MKRALVVALAIVFTVGCFSSTASAGLLTGLFGTTSEAEGSSTDGLLNLNSLTAVLTDGGGAGLNVLGGSSSGGGEGEAAAIADEDSSETGADAGSFAVADGGLLGLGAGLGDALGLGIGSISILGPAPDYDGSASATSSAESASEADDGSVTVAGISVVGDSTNSNDALLGINLGNILNLNIGGADLINEGDALGGIVSLGIPAIEVNVLGVQAGIEGVAVSDSLALTEALALDPLNLGTALNVVDSLAAGVGNVHLAVGDTNILNVSSVTASLCASASVAANLLGGSASAIGACSPQQVPEPSTMLLLGSGLIGLMAFGRRRKN